MKPQDLKANEAMPASYAPVPFNRKFGVEFEGYNVDMVFLKRELVAQGLDCRLDSHRSGRRTKFWKIVPECSILGNGAFELVSPVLTGMPGLEIVNAVCRILNACQVYVNKSCGMHVHFHAGTFSLEHWKNIYVNYALYEPVIDMFMPVSRRADNNGYCRSLHVVPGVFDKIREASGLAEIEDIFGYSRFYKIDPLSFSRFRTIEFRHHYGTIEFEKVYYWILFLHNLVEYSKYGTVADPDFDSLKGMHAPEVITYYHNRMQELGD